MGKGMNVPMVRLVRQLMKVVVVVGDPAIVFYLTQLLESRRARIENRRNLAFALLTRRGYDSSSSNACDSLTPYSVKSTCPLKLLCDDLIID